MNGKRLFRSRTERRIAGVCGGIAENADVDPVFIRLGVVFLSLVAPPVGLIGYLACWMIVPEREADAPASGIYEPPGTPEGSSATMDAGAAPGPAATPQASVRGSWRHGDGSLLGGALFIGVGLFFLMMNLGILDWSLFRFWRWRFVWPLVVIVLGVLMLNRGLRGPRRWSLNGWR